MGRIVLLVFLVGVCWTPLQWAQSPSSDPPPELQKWDIWVGDWTFTGTAKDTATEPEYKLDWRFQGRWILGGHFVEVRSTWKGNGTELSFLEILSYDAARKIHAYSGFDSNGTTWVATAKFGDGTFVETETDTAPDGKTATLRNTWSVSPDGMSISGKEEREQGGVRWTAFTVKGTKNQASLRK
jgi:hypothetical protein